MAKTKKKIGISFGRSQPWSDRLGKHTVIDILRDDKVIGTISGESGVAIPVMTYTVVCEGIPTFDAYRLDEAKAKVRASLASTERTNP